MFKPEATLKPAAYRVCFHSCAAALLQFSQSTSVALLSGSHAVLCMLCVPADLLTGICFRQGALSTLAAQVVAAKSSGRSSSS